MAVHVRDVLTIDVDLCRAATRRLDAPPGPRHDIITRTIDRLLDERLTLTRP